MAVLVTGAGPIGAQIARCELERGEKVSVLDVSPQLDALSTILQLENIRVIKGNILEPFDLIRTIRGEGIESVIHTVANPGHIWGGYSNPYEALKINLMGIANVLEAARVMDLKRVVFISSDALYHGLTGGGDKFAFGRENAYPRPSELYGTAKLAGEDIGLNYADMFGIDFVTVRYPAVFGPWPGGGSGLPSRMFYEIVQNHANRKPAKLLRISAELLYSKDAGRGASMACHATDLKDRVFNIGVGKIYRPEEVMQTVLKAFPSIKIAFEDSADADRAPKATAAMDLSRSAEQLGYQPQYNLETALVDLMDWYKTTQKK